MTSPFFDALSIIIGLQTMNIEYNKEINGYLEIFKCIFITINVIGRIVVCILFVCLVCFIFGFNDNYSIIVYLIFACIFTIFSRDLSLQLIHYFNKIDQIDQNN